MGDGYICSETLKRLYGDVASTPKALPYGKFGSGMRLARSDTCWSFALLEQSFIRAAKRAKAKGVAGLCGDKYAG